MSALIAVPDNKFKLANFVSMAYSGGGHSVISIDASYPVENMFSVDTTKVTRWNYTRNATINPIRIRIKLSASDNIEFDGLAALNIRLDPHVTKASVYCGTLAGSSGAGDGSDYLRADLIPIQGTTDRFNLYSLRKLLTLRGEIWLIIETPINVSGYVEIGHMWGSQGLILPNGIDGNWQLGHVDHGEAVIGPGGAMTAAVRPRTRRIVAPITGRNYATAMGTPGAFKVDNLDAILQAAGTTSPFLFIGRDDDLHSLQKLSAYCRLESSEEIGHAGGNYFGTQLTLNELR
jgi:hypothetical protein